jgi:phosphoribosylglycinamide formyltransferase
LPLGCRFSGPTVHFVDAEYDTGPILAQRVVPVYPTDSPKQLAARVLEQVRGTQGPIGLLYS